METETYTERLAAFDAAQAKLRETTTEALLTSAYLLTHRLHALQDALDGGALTAAERKPLRAEQADKRQGRDMITAEVLRRTEGTSLRVVN